MVFQFYVLEYKRRRHWKDLNSFRNYKHFKNKEKNICVLLKGYGGKKHTFKKVSPNDSATLVGDEAILFQIMYLLIFQQIEC